MKDYISIFIVALIASLIGGFVAVSFSPSQDLEGIVEEVVNQLTLELSGTTNFDALTLDGDNSGKNGDLTVTKGLSTFGTTTVSRSFDGFMFGGGIAPFSVATGTVFTLDTYSGSPALCDNSIGGAYFDSTAFSPSFVFSVGTSTSAIASTNLLASSTAATSTDTLITPTSETSTMFQLFAGEKLTMILADGETGEEGNNLASTTNFSNWDIEYSVYCWLVGG